MRLSKNIELYFVELMSGNDIPDDGTYSATAYKIFADAMELIGHREYKILYKPKVKFKPVYGGRTEPKTDVVISCGDEIYKFSIKMDDEGYLVSCNSQSDFISQFIDIHDGRNILDGDMIEALEKSASYIRKIRNYYSYDKDYKKKND